MLNALRNKTNILPSTLIGRVAPFLALGWLRFSVSLLLLTLSQHLPCRVVGELQEGGDAKRADRCGWSGDTPAEEQGGAFPRRGRAQHRLWQRWARAVICLALGHRG